jgi:hypothetical protein
MLPETATSKRELCMAQCHFMADGAAVSGELVSGPDYDVDRNIEPRVGGAIL